MYYWFASKDKESGYARKALCNCRICANAETFPLLAERYQKMLPIGIIL